MLNLQSPWYIIADELKIGRDNKQERHVSIACKKGAKFNDATGTPCPIWHRSSKKWQHCDIDGLPCYIHCKNPQIKTTDEKIRLVAVPWARTDSRVSLAFEARIMQEVEKGKPFDGVGKLFNKDSHVIGRIFNGWISQAYEDIVIDKNICTIGIDEIDREKQNQTISIIVDLKNERVLRVIPGAGKEALSELRNYLKNKGIQTEQITHISGPLSLNFTENVEHFFPQAEYHVDRMYIIQALNVAMDQMRKKKGGHKKELTDNRQLFLVHHTLLSEEQRAIVLDMITKFPNIGRAYTLKTMFYKLWDQPSPEDAENFLESWCQTVMTTRMLGPLKEFVKILIEQQDYIINFDELPANPTAMEQTHQKILAAISRTKGLKNIENVSNMIYFCCGKLTLPYIPNNETSNFSN